MSAQAAPSAGAPGKTGPSRPALGLGTKFSYGLGSIAYGVAGQALATSLLTFYLNQVVGIAPRLVGLALMISLIFDAVVDPLVGQWSDSTHTRWGRRHPFMYASAIPCAVLFFLLWHAPRGLTPMETFIFMIAILVSVRFCVALYETASTALAPELAPDYHERTGLLAFRWFFGVAGAGVMIAIFNNVFLKKDPLNPVAYQHYGTVTAIVIVSAILISALSTHRLIPYLTAPAQRRVSLGQVVREVFGTLTNPSLAVLMTSGLISGVSTGMQQTLNIYFYYYLFGLTPASVTPIVLAFIPAAILGSIAGPLVSRRLGKKKTMISLFFASLLTSVIPLSLRLMGVLPGDGDALVILVLAIDAFVAGSLGIMGFIIVSSMIADVVEDSAVKTGVRSEGLLFAANGLLPKVTTGVGVFVGSLLLAAANIPSHAKIGSVPYEVMRHLAMLYLPTYLALAGSSIAVLIFYRIDQRTHERNLAALDTVGLSSGVLRDPAMEPGGPFPPPS